MEPKIAFVTPWYGVDATGGAEAEARCTAERLAASGLAVEAWTTCTRHFRADWGHNELKPGVSRENGILVRRFPVRARDRDAFDAVNLKLMAGLSISTKEEDIYLRENINSAGLCEHIAQNWSQYVCIFIPYLFGTTYHGLAACGGQGFLIPCLHDESYARLPSIRRMFESVECLIVHSHPELALLHDLYTVKPSAPVMMGEGVETDFRCDPAAFRDAYGIHRPFVLYAGRKDTGKNVELLVDFFGRYRQRRGAVCDLVLIGGGPLEPTGGPREGVYDLGYLPLQQKYNAYAAADTLCQPSTHESFSLVLMEAWAAGTPALVNGRCAVTMDHVRRSNGGLYFDGYDEFEVCLDVLLNRPGLRRALGTHGQRYVQANYTWDTIIARYRSLIETYWQRRRGDPE